MRSGMITTIAIAMVFFTISSDNFHVAKAQLCGANVTGVVKECQRYVVNTGSISPPPPPSRSCCALVRPVNVTCACGYVTRDVMNLFDLDKVIFVARSCGKKIRSGYQCGSYIVMGGLN